MPWLARNNPIIDWDKRSIQMENNKKKWNIPVLAEQQSSETVTNEIITGVMNIYDEAEKEGSDPIKTNSLNHFLKTVPISSKSPNVEIKLTPEAEGVKKRILSEFKDIFPESLPAGLPPSRGHELTIRLKPDSKPPARAAPRLNYKHSQFESKWIKDMSGKKLIRGSQSEYAAPHFYVPKPETPVTGEYRAVTDFRALNAVTIRNKYPLPRADELFDKLVKAKYFSKIDLRTGFYQILINEKDRHKTAFITNQGLYEYNVLPMGLCNSPAIFMQLMNDTFRDYLNKFVLVYLDDIIVYSNSLEEHEQHLRLALKKLRDQRLFVKLSKSEFCLEEVVFLGHHVGKNGLRVMEDKIEAIQKWPVPTSLKELRAFLGLTGYYRRFVKEYSKIALPLSDLIRTATVGKFSNSWGVTQQSAFIELKQALQSAPVLTLPDPSLPFVVNCDASGYAVGAVLQQDKGNGLQPICYMSRKMNAAETRYPVHEQELLAIVTALLVWKHHLEETEIPVRIRTDHKSLIHFQTQPMLSGRQRRWLEILANYNYVVEYILGEQNVVADALSRRIDHNDGSVPLERQPVFVDQKKIFESNKIFVMQDRSMEEELNRMVKLPALVTEQQRLAQRELANRFATQVIPVNELLLPPANKQGSITMPTQRCVANNAKGEQCGSKTIKGRYCYNHQRMLEGTRVLKSQFPEMGFGLVAAKDFKKDEHVAQYSGDELALEYED